MPRSRRDGCRKDDRRLAGIDRRNDPGIDAEIRRQHHTVPVERSRDALPALAAGGKEGGDAGDENERAQRVRIVPRHPRRRPAGFQCPRGVERALDMGIPQRERIRIFRRDGEIVGDRGRRAMRQPLPRSSRLSASRAPGMRTNTNGNAATTASAAQAITAAARPSGGSHSHRPSQDSARNSPMAVASEVSAGHSRSRKSSSARA